MEMWLIITLSILALLLLIGIIRVCCKPYTGFGNMCMELLMLDIMLDVMGAVLSAIADGGIDV